MHSDMINEINNLVEPGAVKVVIGTRTWLGPDWTHVDIDPHPLVDPVSGNRYPVDVVSDAKKIKMKNESADLVFSQECLEHFHRAEYPVVFAEWCRLVKPGGLLVIQVPDFLACCKQVLETDTLEMDRAIQQLFYGGQVNEFDFHFNGFTPRIFEDDFEKAGFYMHSIKRGWEAGFLQAIGAKRD